MFEIIVAATEEQGIGKDGRIPWMLPTDLKYFRELTSKTTEPNKINCCIMGRKTYFSIPEKFRPLPNRLNMVLTRDIAQTKALINNDRVLVLPSLDDGLKMLYNDFNVERVFVIGGAELYSHAVLHPQCQAIYLTSLCSEPGIPCDVFFPPIPDVFQLRVSKDQVPVLHENGIDFQFLIYDRKK